MTMMRRDTAKMLAAATIAVAALTVILASPPQTVSKTIDVYNSSGGNAAFYPDANYIYYEGEAMERRFRLYGVVDGTPFTGAHARPSGDRFRVHETLTPDDGVWDGLAVPRQRNGTLTVAFFVDSEFREAITPATLTYGQQADRRQRPSWQEIDDGIYRTTVTYAPIERVTDVARVPVFLGDGIPGQDANITGIGIY